MKVKTKLLSLVILLVACFCFVGLAGCCDKKVTIGTLEANYNTLQEIYTKAINEDAFVEQKVDANVNSTKYYINFGSELQKKIDANTAGYVELRNLYNVIFKRVYYALRL